MASFSIADNFISYACIAFGRHCHYLFRRASAITLFSFSLDYCSFHIFISIVSFSHCFRAARLNNAFIYSIRRTPSLRLELDFRISLIADVIVAFLQLFQRVFSLFILPHTLLFSFQPPLCVIFHFQIDWDFHAQRRHGARRFRRRASARCHFILIFHIFVFRWTSLPALPPRVFAAAAIRRYAAIFAGWFHYAFS